jgi:hypothetical protein
MHLYCGTGEPGQDIASEQKLLAAGDTNKLTGSATNIDGIDQAPVLVTPVAPFHGQPAVVVSTCGYRDLQTYGPTGKLLPPDAASGDYAWQISVTKLQFKANSSIYLYKAVGNTIKAVAKCPASY